MPSLYNKKTNALLGALSEEDVQCLIDVLEEEDSKDVDYFVQNILDPSAVERSV